MREILFRAKSDSTKPIWIYGSINLSYMPEINTALIDNGENTYKCLPDTIGQYTGLTDKNGTKIFEGDICKVGNLIYKVEFIHSCWWFTILSSKVYCCPSFNSHCGEYCEIVGNIHDNPELLGGC